MNTSTLPLPSTTLERRRPEPARHQLKQLEAARNDANGHGGTIAAITSAEQDAQLRDALIRLEIDILTDDSVRSYMQEWTERGKPEREALQAEVHRHEQALSLGQEILEGERSEHKGERSEHIEIDRGGSYMSGVLGALVTMVLFWVLAHPVSSSLLAFSWVLSGVVSLLGGLATGWTHWRHVTWAKDYVDSKESLMQLLSERQKAIQAFFWRTALYDEYPAEVPRDVIFKAKRLKEALPEAELVVHYLESGVPEITFDSKVWNWTLPAPVIYPEPFLEIKLGESSAFVAVWDERDYQYTTVQDQDE